jgi:hypothetical protein
MRSAISNIFMSPASSTFARDLLDHLIARIGDGVDGMAEADNDFLRLDPPPNVALGLVGRAVSPLDLERNSLAPPCFGPRRAPIAPVIAE